MRRVAHLALLLVFGGCAGPAPTPPQPAVPGLDRYVAGARAYEAGDTVIAQPLLEQAVHANGGLTMARVLLARIYKEKQDYRHSSMELEAVVQLDPYTAQNHYDLAIAYQFLDRLEEAAAQYLSSLALAPSDLNSHMNLGLVYLALGRPKLAAEQLQAAVIASPNSAAAQCNLGVMLDAAGNSADAEKAYLRAIELEPDQPVATANLGINLVKQQRGDEAVFYLRKAVKNSDTPSLHKHLGDALFLTGKQDEAISQYTLALHEDPQYWPAMNQLGQALIDRYKNGLTLDESLRSQALAYWKRSLALHPDQPVVEGWLAQWSQNGHIVP